MHSMPQMTMTINENTFIAKINEKTFIANVVLGKSANHTSAEFNLNDKKWRTERKEIKTLAIGTEAMTYVPQVHVNSTFM